MIHAARLLLCWLLWLLAAPAGAEQAEARQLLEWLDVLALLEQTPNVISYAVNAEREARGASAREASGWQRRVSGQVDARQLREAIIARVASEVSAAELRHAHALLEQPAARRVRYFAEAMGQRGAAANLREFLQSPPARAPTPERLALLQQLDAASAFTEMVALLQTLAARATRVEAGLLAAQPAATEEVAARQQWLQSRLQAYQHYSYRYLKDTDLAAWLDVLAAPQVQRLVAIATAVRREQLAAIDEVTTDSE